MGTLFAWMFCMAPRDVNISEFLARVATLGPFASKGRARHAVRATLRALADELTADERAEFAKDLPESLRPALKAQATSEPKLASSQRVEQIYARVSRYEGVSLGKAVEHAQVVCRLLTEELLKNATVRRLCKHVPQLAPLFMWSEPPGAPARPQHGRQHEPHDLAGGRPGSKHPLASSDTHTLAHRHSVARSDDPHADSRLSSTSGTAQEREGRTLASGRPGSRAPLSEAH